MDGTLYVVVHPFFFIPRDARQYRGNMVKFFRQPHLMILCEMEYVVTETINKIQRINPSCAPVLMVTKVGEAQPVDGWESLFRLIEAQVHEKIMVCGAQLVGNPKIGYGACVGGTYTKLKKSFPTVELDLSLCYRPGS